MSQFAQRWAWAEIDLDAVEHNITTIGQMVAPAEVWAVVKADGYGHGSVPVAQAALRAGAAGLTVALAGEGVVLRHAGITAPILVLSEQPPESAVDLVAHRLIPTVATAAAIDHLDDTIESMASSVTTNSEPERFDVHLKVDTGMRRVGCEPDDAPALVERIAASRHLRLAGVFTHLAVADELGRDDTARQLATFDRTRRAVGPVPLVHAANSAGALAHPDAHHSMVRVGIATYGISPGPDLDEVAAALRPVLSLKARVSFVKQVPAGDRVSYGLRHEVTRETTLATVPIGYADGVRRLLSGHDIPVLIGGRRHPIVGTITMDQLLVDCGDDDVRVGDEVVLIGEQNGDRLRAEDWARAIGTIGYEITCGISARVPRRYVGGGGSSAPDVVPQ